MKCLKCSALLEAIYLLLLTLIKSLWHLLGVYLFVREGSNATGLILQTGLSPLLYITHIPQIPHQDSSSCSANDQPVSSHRECVHLSEKWHDKRETERVILIKLLILKMQWLQIYSSLLDFNKHKKCRETRRGISTWLSYCIYFCVTFSGWVKVPALQGVLGSHSRTDLSQLPVTMTLTSGQYSTQRMGASCVPTIVSVRRKYTSIASVIT